VLLLQDITLSNTEILVVYVTGILEQMTFTARGILDLVVKPSVHCRAFNFLCFLFHQVLEVLNFITFQAYSGNC